MSVCVRESKKVRVRETESECLWVDEILGERDCVKEGEKVRERERESPSVYIYV